MATRKKDPHRPPEDALWMVPLGGCGEIGMNLYLYGTRGKWLMVECGVTFPDESTPGIEIIMPDISFIEERRDDLVGLVVTHGHEDHIGAIEYLWANLKCPVYATRFTAAMIRSKLEQSRLRSSVRLIELPDDDPVFEIGPFRGEMVRVTHSVPDSRMLALTTPDGVVIHTGDWKFDPDPVVGPLSDEARLKELGDAGVMAVVGDSTNAMLPGHSQSERTVEEGMRGVFAQATQRVVVTCFSSNVARMKTIAKVARETGRYVALIGRSIWRNAETAHDCGLLPEFADFLTEHEAMQSPHDKIVLIMTGCQGEPRSALARVSLGEHPVVDLDKGDTVVFSSRDIPGNEKAIGRVQNNLIRAGVRIVTGDMAHVHVSGHGSQEEIARLYALTRPKLSVPVHGELRHQTAHAQIARDAEVAASILPANGQIVRLGPGISEIVGEVPVGRVGLDGRVLRALDLEAVRGRRKLSFNGAVVVTVLLDQRGRLAHEPRITMLGVEDDAHKAAIVGEMVAVVMDAIDGMAASARLGDAAVEKAVVQTCRRFLNETQGKKPMVEVHVMRV